jgi:inner membrane transporter RhtA
MNLLFYSSLQTIPLGVAVALEFTGPLGVAIADSHRPVDFAWIALCVLGLLLLLPFGGAQAPLQPLGIVYALGAGFCWAMYIVYGRRAGAEHGGQTTALGMLVGAIVVVPAGIAHVGSALFAPALLPVAAAVALLSSALPYSMEMYAMTRLPPKTFGVLMSLDPALAALFGLWLLGERLTWIQWSAIACVILASAGSAATARAGGVTAPLPE